MTVVVEVSEECTCRVFQEAQTRSISDVLEGSIAAIAIEAVGKSGGLANVEIVEAVVVDVGDRDSVMAVDVDAASGVKHGAPVVAAVQELSGIGRIAAESNCGDIDEDGPV